MELLLASVLNCHESQELIDAINQYATLTEYKEELIQTIKTNTLPECYEGSERNSWKWK